MIRRLRPTVRYRGSTYYSTTHVLDLDSTSYFDPDPSGEASGLRQPAAALRASAVAADAPRQAVDLRLDGHEA